MKEFIEKVREMRLAQKEYFRTRKTTALIRSKEQEKEVDTLINQFKLNF